MKKLITWVANLKIASKIWWCMVIIALTLSLFIGLFSSWYFLRLYEEDTYTQTADSLQIGTQSLTDSYNHLLANIIKFASTADFTKIVSESYYNNHVDDIKNKANIQEPLSYLTYSNPLLDSVALIGKNGEFHSLFTNTLKKNLYPNDFFGWDKGEIQHITWLSLRPSPFVKNNDVIPLIVPIRLLGNSRYLNIASSYEKADLLIVLLLDPKQIEDRLSVSNSTYTQRQLYIANAYGEIINLAPSSKKNIGSLLNQNDSLHEISLLKDSKDYSLYGKSLNFCGLTLVEILPKNILYQRIFRMNAFIFFIVILGLVMAALLSLMLSRFVTRPFSQLVSDIKNIENNTYHTPHHMKYEDEIGHLSGAINSMHATIQHQFEHIKDTERAKYRSEIQLLSEQINPHFLYNTLECINMEVMGGHTKAAASMIRSLGDFLRIGLSHGNELIPLSKELTHVKAYMDIMNYRFCKKVDLVCIVAPELENLFILKLILQPLVENSIRHGFSQNIALSDPIVMPEIKIKVFQEKGRTIIAVTDNGCGIDVEKATASLYSKVGDGNQKSHVGLNNIYQRLSAYYGVVEIIFETIPYYSNTVTLLF